MRVAEGELINLKGKVLSIDGNTILILPKHEDLKVSQMKYALLLKTYFVTGLKCYVYLLYVVYI